VFHALGLEKPSPTLPYLTLSHITSHLLSTHLAREAWRVMLSMKVLPSFHNCNLYLIISTTR